MSLCKYKDIFGKPGKGIHSYRFMDIAIVDVIATLLVAFIISYFTKQTFFHVSIILFILGIISHRLFCVRTTVDKLLFST
jgi:hypothetical protein